MDHLYNYADIHKSVEACSIMLALAFTILDDNANPNSPSGSNTVAMFNAQEKYEQLCSTTINGHEFT